MKRLAQVSLLLALAAYLLGFWNAWLSPPLGTDSLIYHLTIPARWLQHGFLSPVELPFHDSAAEHAPMLAETINYGLMAASGDDSLVWIVQPAFLLATFWLFYLSSRLLGAGRPIAMLLTALLTLFGPFLFSARTSNNELVMTCGVAWMLYGVLLAPLRPRQGLMHGACGLGLTAATKYVGLIYAAVAVVLLTPLLWRTLRRRKGAAPRRVGYGGTAVVALALLIGAFFYVRNWRTLGNPVYPARVQVAGATVLPGLYDPAPLVAHGWQPALLAKMLVHSPQDFTIRMPTSLVLWTGLGASIILAFWSPRRWPWLGFIAVVVYPVAVLLVYFWKVPFWNEHRLLFPVYYTLWLSVSNALAGIRRIGRRGAARKVPLALLGVFVLQFGLGINQRLGAFFSARELSKWSRLEIRETYKDVYPSAAPAWSRIAALTAEQPAVIGYAGTATVFPLYGPCLKNEVVYVPVGRADRPQPIEVKAGESLYRRLAEARRRNPEPDYWLEELARRRVEYLYLVDNAALGGVKQELRMIEQRPERFELLLQEHGVHLYRVREAP